MHLLIELFLILFSKRSAVFIKYAVVVKENEILKRNLEAKGHRVSFNNSDRRLFHFLLKLFPRVKRVLTIVKPSTVLYKWNNFKKGFWIFPHKSNPGRPPVSAKIRKLIIEIKKLNPVWGFRRIVGELLKLNIDVSKDTVRRVIQKGRNDGDIIPTGSWFRFTKAHLLSLLILRHYRSELLRILSISMHGLKGLIISLLLLLFRQEISCVNMLSSLIL